MLSIKVLVKMNFLSGLPRSGSTVLAAVLNQHPLVYASPTSGLIDLMGSMVKTWESEETIHVQGRDDTVLYELLRGVVTNAHPHTRKPVIINKNRGWTDPKIIRTMTHVLGKPPKIIATVRDVPDCVASFVRVVKPKDVQDFLSTTHLIDVIKSSYQTLMHGFDAFPACFLFIEYEDLVDNPREELKRIHDFLQLPDFEYDLEKISGDVVAEKDDEIWQIPGLHDIKPKLSRLHKQSSQDILGYRFAQYVQPRFWRGETESRLSNQPLDIQREAAKRGDFKKAWEIAKHLEATEPNNHRAAFNRGLYVLMQGRLKEGMALLSRGRIEGVFGDKMPQIPTPLWQGQNDQTVLLYLEGGLGDQIHQMGYVRYFLERNCRVILSCAPELVVLGACIPGVNAVVTHEACGGVFNHAWVPGMSAPMYLGLEYDQLKGSAYLSKPVVQTNKRFRVGLRWQGNPLFENDHHKYFSPYLLFNAVQHSGVEFVSLQRDEGAQHRPDWVQETDLSTWSRTCEVASSCDLVISSCTSVAHLSASMGVPTWIVVPILPYFLWAVPGERTPWYDSVTLFRQEVYGDWSAPFDRIKVALINLLGATHANSNRILGTSR